MIITRHTELFVQRSTEKGLVYVTTGKSDYAPFICATNESLYTSPPTNDLEALANAKIISALPEFLEIYEYLNHCKQEGKEIDHILIKTMLGAVNDKLNA